MRVLRSVFAFVFIGGLRGLAAEQSYPDGESAAPLVPVKAPVIEARTPVAIPQPVSIELNAQLALLAEMVRDHSNRFEAARTAGQTDKVAWEEALLREFRDKMATIATALATNAPGLVKEEPAVRPATDGNEAAFISRLDERLAFVRQQLAASLDVARTYALELETNNSPSSVAVVSRQLDDNRRELRELDRELADLELRRLEFIARRK